MMAVGQDPNWMPYVGSAVFLVAVAWGAMRWTRRTVEKDLDPANTGRMRASMALKADVVPPTLVKEALAKGLVSSSQLATMSPIERQFLFAQLAPKLSGTHEGGRPPATDAPPQLGSVALPLKPTAPAARVDAPQLRSTQAIPVIPGKPMNLPPLTPEQIAALGAPPAAARHEPVSTAFADDTQPLRVFCPCCGTLLTMPPFPPNVAFCDTCGAKTAVRTEQQGRLVINTALPGVTRRPIR